MVALNQLSFPMAPGEPRSENAGHVDVATAEGGWVRIGWLYIEPPKNDGILAWWSPYPVVFFWFR